MINRIDMTPLEQAIAQVHREHSPNGRSYDSNQEFSVIFAGIYGVIEKFDADFAAVIKPAMLEYVRHPTGKNREALRSDIAKGVRVVSLTSLHDLGRLQSQLQRQDRYGTWVLEHLEIALHSEIQARVLGAHDGGKFEELLGTAPQEMRYALEDVRDKAIPARENAQIQAAAQARFLRPTPTTGPSLVEPQFVIGAFKSVVAKSSPEGREVTAGEEKTRVAGILGLLTFIDPKFAEKMRPSDEELSTLDERSWSKRLRQSLPTWAAAQTDPNVFERVYTAIETLKRIDSTDWKWLANSLYVVAATRSKELFGDVRTEDVPTFLSGLPPKMKGDYQTWLKLRENAEKQKGFQQGIGNFETDPLNAAVALVKEAVRLDDYVHPNSMDARTIMLGMARSLRALDPVIGDYFTKHIDPVSPAKNSAGLSDQVAGLTDLSKMLQAISALNDYVERTRSNGVHIDDRSATQFVRVLTAQITAVAMRIYDSEGPLVLYAQLQDNETNFVRSIVERVLAERQVLRENEAFVNQYLGSP
ncbi:MAG: hypothetical protein R3C68_12805 [Myxococcota bacterium]